MTYYVYKMDLRHANQTYRAHHRHLNEVQGHHMSFLMTGTKDYFNVNRNKHWGLWLNRQFLNPFSDDAKDWDNVGVLSIGRPVGRFKDKTISEITRICFNPLFKPRGKPDSFERTLPSKFVLKALEIYESYYPHVSKIITYIGADESGAFLKHAGFKVDKIVKPSDGWVRRREKELAGVENFYGYDSDKLRVFKQSIETHKKMNKQKFRLIKNL